MGLMGAQGGCGETGTTKATSSTYTPPDSTDGSVSDPAGDTPAFTPTASMYRVRVKITSKECFGEAGCNVEAKLLLTVIDSDAVNQPVELTVRITGGSDGASVETIDVDADGNYSPPEILVQTATSSTVLRAKITEVESNA